MSKKAIAVWILCLIIITVSTPGCGTANESIEAVDPEASVPLTMLWRGSETLSPMKRQLLQRKLKEKFNVSLHIEIYEKDEYEKYVNALMNSGKVPDIVWMSSERIRGASAVGALMPLDELIKASPIWSGMPKEYFADSTYNGKMYSLPQFFQAPESIYYRADWAEKLQIKTPVNADELYTMLYRFTKEDPDGDGKANTTGFTMGGDLSRSGPLWKLFVPAHPRKLALYLDPVDDTIKSAYLSSKEMKEALAWFRKAYENGVLDKEWVLEKRVTAEDKFTSGKTGAWIRGAEMITERYDKLKARFPNAAITTVPTMTGPYGSNYTVRAGYSSSYVIPSTTRYPKEAKMVLDYLLGPEGTKLTAIGFEGLTYKIVDGKICWMVEGEEKYYNPGAVLFSVHPLMLPVPIPVLEQNRLAVNGFKTETSMNSLYIPRSEKASGKAPAFEKLALEYISKIITGQYPVDKYDAFVAEAKRMGIDAVLKELNEMYKMDKKMNASE
ncbi:extracellular solute-binding protein [Paenibacillus sp. H1-7]|uniref:extracellular solute-binding protein n=1 Tax=Paenibacillus sp. H1-7 TaxID=2282849 RepID=UPI001EF8A901|nr:extracellular solute-binding protein [Paenibacillus sp. H1-7]ULL17916.1 extracellular solute-binding protein [Paenibacillus sp. H1-7]